jgi:hypothetical protein
MGRWPMRGGGPPSPPAPIPTLLSPENPSPHRTRLAAKPLLRKQARRAPEGLSRATQGRPYIDQKPLLPAYHSRFSEDFRISEYRGSAGQNRGVLRVFPLKSARICNVFAMQPPIPTSGDYRNTRIFKYHKLFTISHLPNAQNMAPALLKTAIRITITTTPNPHSE